MKTGTIADVQQTIIKGLSQLAEAYSVYWPATGRNDAGERNLTLHVGHALRAAGYYTLAEANFPRSRDARMDLVALDTRAGIQLAIEAKRLYSSERASYLLADARRLIDFELSDEFAEPPPVQRRIGILLASTFKPEYVTWWNETTRGAPAGAEDQEPWEGLIQLLGKNATWGSVRLGATKEDEDYHGLYAIWELPKPGVGAAL